jgi:hypothetical protein
MADAEKTAADIYAITYTSYREYIEKHPSLAV